MDRRWRMPSALPGRLFPVGWSLICELPLCLLLACWLSLSGTAGAQGHPGGGGPGGPPGGGQGGRQRNGPGQPGGGPGGPMQDGSGNQMGDRGVMPPGMGSGSGRGVGERGGAVSLQSGPIGRWWDDKTFSTELGLRAEQRKRMDAIFNENRDELTVRYQTLRREEMKLEAATRDAKLSSGGVFGQIDRVAQARDALEQTNARLLGAIRKELDAEQIERMRTLK